MGMESFARGEGLWLDIMKCNLGLRGSACECSGSVLYQGQRVKGWWGEVVACLRDDKGEWFAQAVERWVGFGDKTLFWDDIWVGEEKLRVKFPRLFELCLEKDIDVASAGAWVDNRWVWGFGWRRALRGWENEAANNLVELLECRKMTANEPDKWRWKADVQGKFSVRSGYTMMMERKYDPEHGNNSLSKLIWRNLATAKVQATVWRIIHKRIATRNELRKRGVIPNTVSLSCPLCDRAEESTDHLFVECSRSWELWSCVLRWIGVQSTLKNKVAENLTQFCSLGNGKNQKVFLASLWSCTVWLIWKQRNEIVFNGGEWKMEKLFGEIKAHVWSWIMSKNAECKSTQNFSEWCASPLNFWCS